MTMHHTYHTYRQVKISDGGRRVLVEHEAGSNTYTLQMERLDALGVAPDYQPHEPIRCAEQGAVMLWMALTYSLFGTNDGADIKFTTELFDDSGFATTEGRDFMTATGRALAEYLHGLRSDI